MVPNRDSTMEFSDIERIVGRISKTCYVIVLRGRDGKLTYVPDFGSTRPWSSHNKKLADFHASGTPGATAMTWADAFQLMLKENPNFERELIARVAAIKPGPIRVRDDKPFDVNNLPNRPTTDAGGGN